MPHLKRRAACALGMLLAGAPAAAHLPGADAARGDSPLPVTLLLGLFAVLYSIGLARLWPHSHDRRALRWRALAFGAGCSTLAVLLLGPLDAAAPQSFALHMIQHEGLMLIAAPLLVFGRGMPLFMWALPHRARLAVGAAIQAGIRGGWHWLSAPLIAWLLHALVLWLWHAPPFFNAALRSPMLHEWQHVSFLVSALLFWHALLRRSSHASQGAALVYLLTTTIHTGVLGALLTFARAPLYTALQQGIAPYFGLTPLEDQQLGGLLMWVPGALVYTGVALWLLARWIGPERSTSNAAT